MNNIATLERGGADTSILENVSENRKRGRPEIMCSEERQDYSGIWPDIKTARGLQNKYYQSQAVKLIMDKPEFSWLLDSRVNRVKQTLLTELGRIANDDALLEAARALCRIRPSTSDGVAMIRRYRLDGHKAPEHVMALHHKLTRMINAHLQRYDNAPYADILSALELTKQQIQKAAEGEQ